MVKVLDFGLAKALEPDGDERPRTRIATRRPSRAARRSIGVILGTAAYMSPEQAKGKRRQTRGHLGVWRRALRDADGPARVQRRRGVRDAGVGDQRHAGFRRAAGVDAAATACADRTLPRARLKLRLRDIGEAWILLANPLEPAPSPATTRPSSSGRWPWVVTAASILAAAAVVAGTFAGWWRLTRENPQPVVHLDADFGDGLTVLSTVGISPDGQRVAFVGADENGKMYLAMRRLNETTVTRLRPIEGEVTEVTPPFFSPDSQWIAYVSDRQLMKIAVTGGPATRIAGGIVTNFGQGRWGADEILVPAYAGMVRVSIKGGTSVATPFPMAAFLPDGRTMLISGSDIAIHAMTVVTPGDTTPRPVRRLLGRYARYVPIGYLVYIDENEVLQAVAFDVKRMEASGDPMPLMEQVSWFDISDTGTLIFSRTEADPWRTIGWFDEAGRTETIVKQPGNYVAPQLSPDGTRLAFSVVDRGNRLVFVHDFSGGITRPLASAEANLSNPLWMPDGRNILCRGSGGIWIMRADGSGAPRRLIEIAGRSQDAVSPDGHSLAVNISGTTTKRDILRVPLSGAPDALRAGTPEPLVAGPADEINPVYSPDGKWLAYSSDQSGDFQVYVLAVGDPQSRWQVSSVRGVAYPPRWAPGSQQLFFKGMNPSLLVASVLSGRRCLRSGSSQAIWRIGPSIAHGCEPHL